MKLTVVKLPRRQELYIGVAEDRALVTENVRDFRRPKADALARGAPRVELISTTDRQFARGNPSTIGRLVTALAGCSPQNPIWRPRGFSSLLDRDT